MIRADDVTKLLHTFTTPDDGETEKSRELALALLAWSPEPFSRNMFTPGHITCTGVVLSPKRKRVLLVHHARLNRWLLPGGHVEAEDTEISETARREVIEETGAVLAKEFAPMLVGIDVHPIPSNNREPLHLHHDLIFAFQARSRDSRCSAESRQVAWCDLGDFDRYELPASIRRSVLRSVSNVETNGAH